MKLALFTNRDRQYPPQPITTNEQPVHWLFAALFLTLSFLSEKPAFAQQYTISTFAASGATVRFSGNGLAVDTAGNVFATGSAASGGAWNTVILNAKSAVPVVGSSNRSNPFPGCGQAANNVGMTDLGGVALDASRNVYIAQSGNGPILRVSGGTATCPLGNSTYFTSLSIATDTAGNAYFSASVPNKPGYVVYQLTAAGAQMTFAGNGSLACTGGAIGTPQGLAVDSAGNLYIADSFCNVIWKVSQPGATPVKVAGNGAAAFSGDGGAATSASLNQPHGVAVDLDGNLYIADWANDRIREVSASSNTITTIAGTGTTGFSGDGGPALSAQFSRPWGIAVGPGGMIYVGDQTSTGNPGDIRVRALTPVGAMIISPAPGSTFVSTSVTFNWTGAPTGSQYKLDVSDKIGLVGQGDIFFSGATTATSQPVANIPCDGRTIYVQLQTLVGGQWMNPGRYTYTACQALTFSVTPASLPKGGGLVTLSGTADNVWPQSAQLTVTEAIYPSPPCVMTITGLRCPVPATVGTAMLASGNSQNFTFNVTIAALPATYQYAVRRVFVATLTSPSGAVLASRSIYQTQY